MRNIFNFNDFLLESTIIDKFTKSVDINFEIEGGGHFFKRLHRDENIPDENGSTVILKEEVVEDIKSAIKTIVRRNLFNVGIYWDPKNKDSLNKEIVIKNKKTKLNTVVMITKYKEINDYRYKFTIKTVMRTDNFMSSNSEIIYV